MKQVININFQGRVVPIEQTAYDALKQYIESLNRFFANEEGREEIVNDIENRIAELFQQRLKDGVSCITDDDVSAIMKSMGRPEDFESEDGTAASASGSTTKESSEEKAFDATAFSKGGHRRLFRDENNKVLGGVCSGLANYLGIDTVVVRILFVLLSGVALVPYIILWVVIPSTATTQIGSMRKRLFRDMENKYVAGVASGLANYFGINVWIPRLLFLLPFLSFVDRWNHWGNFDFPGFLRFGFSPGSLMVYIILWLVIPEATTTSEKLEMKGEKVDMNSIKNSVMEEMKGVHERATKLGLEAKAIAKEKGKIFASEVTAVGRRGGNGFGNAIALVVKIFVYFILGTIGFFLVVGLFFLAIGSIGIFPLKDFVLTSGWQNAYAWGTLIFFIFVPVIGVITWIIRKIAKIRTGSTLMATTFSGLWVIGWVSVVMLCTSVTNDFRRENNFSPQEVRLTNPGVNKLIVSAQGPMDEFRRQTFFRFQPFANIDDDTAVVRNITINIFKSTTDSFRVTLLKVANGRKRAFADTAAALIRFNVAQQDSVLTIDKGIAINKDDKFRNQQVVLNIYVPVGKQIRIDGSVPDWGGVHINGLGISDRTWDFESENASKGWRRNVDYIMKADGLYTLSGQRAEDHDDNWGRRRTKTIITKDGVTVEERYDDDNSDNDNYRYDQNDSVIKMSIDSVKDKLKLDRQRVADSIKKSIEKSRLDIEKANKELEKLNKKTEGTTAMNFPVLQAYNPMLMMN